MVDWITSDGLTDYETAVEWMESRANFAEVLSNTSLLNTEDERVEADHRGFSLPNCRQRLAQ